MERLTFFTPQSMANSAMQQRRGFNTALPYRKTSKSMTNV